MFRNYLTVAIRNLFGHRAYSLINVLGLAIGLACCILILSYVQTELSYDRHHAHSDRIYRFHSQFCEPDGSLSVAFCTLAPSFVPLLENEFPELERAVRLFGGFKTLVTFEDKNFVEERLYYAEEDIFDVFTIPLLRGDPHTVLKDPFSIVLSRSMAEKYFVDEDPLGKQLVLDSERPFQVTGVMEDVPPNSHFHFDFLVSFITFKDDAHLYGPSNFSDNVCLTYLRLAKGANPTALEARFPAFLDRHLGTIRNRTGRTVPAREEQRLKLRKVTDIHLHSHTRNELEPNSDIRYLLLFVLIAAFILLIACINFINLSTALAGKRMKEVGLRKVVGANRIQLLIQFFGESVFLALLSMLLALGLVELVSPYFNSFAGGADLLAGRVDLSLLLVAFLVTGLVAFSAERRTKEIGIRKVLSASVPGTRPSKSPRRILLMPCGMNKKNQSR